MRKALGLALFLVSCGPEPLCDADLLMVQIVKGENGNDPAKAATNAARAVTETCRAEAFDPALWSWLQAAANGNPPPTEAEVLWTPICSQPLDLLYSSPLIHNRELAEKECTLEAGTAWAAGDPFLALTLERQLASTDEIESNLLAEVTKAIRGGSAEPTVKLPITSGARVGSTDNALFIAADALAGPTLAKLATQTKPESDVLFAALAGINSASGVQVDGVGTVSLSTTSGVPPVLVVATALGFDIVQSGVVTPATDCGMAICGDPSTPETIATLASSLPKGPIAIRLSDDLPFSIVHDIRAVTDAVLWIPHGHIPCSDAHNDMTCIAGGPTIVSMDGRRSLVELSTFWADKSPMTGDALNDCVAAGACPAQAGRTTREQVATNTAWYGAAQLCAQHGKRLLTEWEWEAFATEDIDVAEWTGTWKWSEPDRCGELCAGRDPLGPCDASHPCTNYYQRIVRSSTERRFVAHKSFPADVHVRCGTDKPYLTGFPPKTLGTPRPAAPALEPPTAEQLAIFHSVVDDDIEEKPICDEARRAQLDCRDPQSYLTANEERQHVYRRYIENVGGAYVGVASDQNYSWSALARSEWVWLMDYDPQVVRLHKLNEPLIFNSPTAAEFVAKYEETNADQTEALIREYWKDDPEVNATVRMFWSMRRHLQRHYSNSTKMGTPDDAYGWLRQPSSYAHIHTLHKQDRIRAVKGDMLKHEGALFSIGSAARKLGVPVRIYYTSNAPDAWGGIMTPEYRANVRNLFMDEESLVLNVFGFKTGFGQTGYWHFNVQSGLQQQERLGLEGYNRVWELVTERVMTDDPDVTVMGLPQ
jgi:hypothetical protein